MISSCEPGANLPNLQTPAASGGYRLGNGDQVRVITFGEQTLTGQFSIDDGGMIALPLLGPMPADGLTTHALADEISTALRARKLIADPSVVVEVATYRPIYVLGEVQHPGQFPYRPHMTMLTAVALAGGFTPRAVESRASVVRFAGDRTVEGRLDRESQLAPGDVVTIFERNF